MSHVRLLTHLHEKGNPLLTERYQRGRFNKLLVGVFILCGIIFFALTIGFLHQEFPEIPYLDLWKVWLWQWEAELILVLLPFVLGVYSFWASFRNMYLSLRTRILKKENPGLPWEWDYPWKTKKAQDDLFQLFFWRFFLTVIFLMTLTVITWEWVMDILWEPTRMLRSIIQGIFMVFAFFVVGLGLRKSLCEGWRYLRFGRQQLRYNFFPFVLGGQISLVLANVPQVPGRLFLTFRCIEEEIVRAGLNYDVNFYQIFIKRQIIDSSQLVAKQLTIDMDLPDDYDYVTQLSRLPSRYWELEIHANTPGPEFRCRFLLPVYARG